MHIRVATVDGTDPVDCPHQFVGRCSACSAPVRPVEHAETGARSEYEVGAAGISG